jgi:hypothetical protein
MTASASDRDAASGARGRDLRLLAGLIAAALIDSVLMLGVPQAAGAVLFLPLVGLLFPLVLFALVGFATGGIIRLAGGGRGVLAGVLAAIAAAIAAVVLFAQSPHIPMNWIPALGVDVGAVAAGPIAAAAAAIAVPRRWARVLGAVLVVAVVAAVAVPAMISAAQQRAAEEEQERQAREEDIENFVDTAPRPVTTDWSGAHPVRISPGGYSPTTWLVTDDGGAMELTTFEDPLDESRRDASACWRMAPLGGIFDETVTMDMFAGICEVTGEDSWALVDGSALAVVFDGRLVVLDSPFASVFEDLGAQRGATGEELAAAAEHLRIVTGDEVREALLSMPAENL